MSCHQIQDELMMAFVLQEADPAPAQAVHRHLVDCDDCRERVEMLQTVLRQEAETPAPAASLQGLSALLERQTQARPPSWRLFRRHPSLTAAAAALLALVFSAGYVQGNLVGRRAMTSATAEVARTRPLPAPPELGLPMQTASIAAVTLWSSGSYDSVRHAAPAVDSL